MKLGQIDLPIPLFLAPMAGVSDAPFRRLCREQGACAAVTEMVSAKALYYQNRGTDRLLRRPMDAGVLGLQIFGSDPEILAEMAAVQEKDYDFIDLNMGCPMPKIVSNGDGSALLEKPELAFEILQTMARALTKPLTVKIRIGVNREKMTGRQIALLAEKAGAAAVFVHGRTRAQLYSGRADWEEIRRIREALHVPVIGNGDIASPEDALSMREITGCAGVMVGRAARGNPWIFREIKAAWLGEAVPPRPSREEMAESMEKHIRWELEEKGEYVGCRELRSHLAWYTSGMQGGAVLRKQASAISTEKEAKDFLRAFVGITVA